MSTPDDEALQGALRAAAARATALLRSSPDLQRQVPGLDWTAAETAAHMVAVLRIFADACRRDLTGWPLSATSDRGFHARLAAFNAAAIRVVLGEAVPLGDSLAEAAGTFLERSATLAEGAALPTPWYGEGVTRSATTLLALALAEVTVHSLDIARACGRRWNIDPVVARTIARTAFRDMVPLILDPDATRRTAAVIEVRVRGDAPFVVRIHRGTATTSSAAAAGRIDCHLSVDPVAFMLVGYGRVSQWPQLARGRLLAWGRRPWLGLRFRRMFVLP